jgi:hypothetical protein
VADAVVLAVCRGVCYSDVYNTAVLRMQVRAHVAVLHSRLPTYYLR